MARVKELCLMALFSKVSLITEFYWISDFLILCSKLVKYKSSCDKQHSITNIGLGREKCDDM